MECRQECDAAIQLAEKMRIEMLARRQSGWGDSRFFGSLPIDTSSLLEKVKATEYKITEEILKQDHDKILSMELGRLSPSSGVC